MKKKRIAIIGAGPGGYTAALGAASSGADVTLIERDGLGGTCLHWGCIPSKTMKNTADLLMQLKKAESFGINGTEKATVNVKQVVERQLKLIDTLEKGIDAQLSQAGVTRLSGNATIKKPGVLGVKGSDQQAEEIAWDKLIIATGSSPYELPGAPFDGDKILSSSDLLRLEKLPESIIIVGGGVIGAEFAFILNAFGCKVTVIEGLPRLLPLPVVDQDCSKILARQMKKRGITVQLQQLVKSIQVDNNQVVVHTSMAIQEKDRNNEDTIQSSGADKVLVCVGRKPNSSELHLDKLGIILDKHGWIEVDECLRTANNDVFAIGDILGPNRPMLAHVASREGIIAASNCMGAKEKVDYRFVPSVVFSSPEIGCVGLSEEQAVAEGFSVSTHIFQFRQNGKAHVIDEIDGMVKIISDAGGVILGVHMIGPHASDLIAEGVLAVKNGLRVKDLAETIHAHPTLAEVVMEAAMAN